MLIPDAKVTPREMFVFKGESLKLQCEWKGDNRPKHLGFNLEANDTIIKRIHNTSLNGDITQAWIYIDDRLMSYNCPIIHIRCVETKENGTDEKINDDPSWFRILGGKYFKPQTV